MSDPHTLARDYAAMMTPASAPAAPETKAAEPARDPKAMAQSIETADKPPPEDPKTAKVWTFAFEHKGPGGTTYRAQFSNTVLSIDRRLQAATLESKLLGGVPYESIDPQMGIIAKAVAHLTYSLSEPAGQSPAGWADNLMALDDPGVIIALFSEVLSHEETFRGLGADSEGGEGQS